MALTTNLLAWWDGDNRRDSHTGGHDLTEHGAVTYPAGKIGNCFQPSEGGNKYWSIANADASAFDFGTKDMTFAFWIEQLDHGGNEVIFQYGAANTTVDGITIWSNGNDKIIVYVSDGTTLVGKQFAANMSGGAWYCLVLELDRSGNMTLYVNDVSVGTANISAMSASDIQPATDLYIGSDGTNELDNKLDSVAVWDRLLGSADRALYYNDGDGVEAQTEIEWNYNYTGSTARRVKVEAKAAKLSGSGSINATPWLITEDELPDEIINTAETATVEASGAPTLRASLDEAGSNQIALKIIDFTPASGGVGGGATAQIWLNVGSYTGGTALPVYLWWDPDGSQTQPPATSLYGAQEVYSGHTVAFDAVTNPTGSAGDVPDSAGNHDGTSSGSIASLVTGPGSIAKAWDLDGTNDEITFGTFDIENSVTVKLWAKKDDLVSRGTYVGKHDASGNNQFLFLINSDNEYETYAGNFINPAAEPTTDWEYLVLTLTENGANTDRKIYRDGTLLSAATGTHTGGLIGDVSGGKEWVIGQEWDGGTKGDWFGGLIAAFRIIESVDTNIADIAATEYNNQNDSSTFWDHSFPVTQPGVSGYVPTYEAAANITVQHKIGLSAILAYESPLDYSLTNKLGLKARSVYESGAAGSLTHTLGLAASVVASHNAGANFSTTNKTGRASIVAIQEGISVSGTDVFGRVAVVNHEGDITFSDIHITGRQARSNHEIGAVYSALTVEIRNPVSLSLSIEHLNKITLTIEKVS